MHLQHTAGRISPEIRRAGKRSRICTSGLRPTAQGCHKRPGTSGLDPAANLTCALPHKRPPALVAACAGSLGQAARSLSLSLGAADGARPLSFGARALLSLGEHQLSLGARALSLRARALTRHARALTRAAWTLVQPRPVPCQTCGPLFVLAHSARALSHSACTHTLAGGARPLSLVARPVEFHLARSLSQRVSLSLGARPLSFGARSLLSLGARQPSLVARQPESRPLSIL